MVARKEELRYHKVYDNLWGTLSVPALMAVHSILFKMFQHGPKWLTEQPSNIAGPQAKCFRTHEKHESMKNNE